MKDQINFVHVRKLNIYSNHLFNKRLPVTTKGGFTIAYKFNDDERTITYNAARCSDKDAFCKKTGRELATERLNATVERAGFLTSAVSYDEFPCGKPTYKGIANYFNSQFQGRS